MSVCDGVAVFVHQATSGTMSGRVEELLSHTARAVNYLYGKGACVKAEPQARGIRGVWTSASPLLPTCTQVLYDMPSTE